MWIFAKLILQFDYEWLTKRNLSNNALVNDKFSLDIWYYK
jgi:hypothetical protein